MATLQMRHMHNRYRLSPSRLGERTRLDRIVDSMFDGTLEQALQTSGLEPGGVICVRRIDVPVRVRLSGSDAVIAATWCRAIAAALAAAVAQRDGTVASYVSLRHAVFEMAYGVAQGDLARAWAWRSLGLMRRSDGPESDLSSAVDDLVQCLSARSSEVVHVLGELARAGLLRGLATRMRADQWIRLALTRAAMAGLPDATRAEVDSMPAGPRTEGNGHAMAKSQSTQMAVELSKRSMIFTALAGQPALLQDSDVRHAVALLVVLEAEPGMASGGSEGARRLIADVAHLLLVPESLDSPPHTAIEEPDFSGPPDAAARLTELEATDERRLTGANAGALQPPPRHEPIPRAQSTPGLDSAGRDLARADADLQPQTDRAKPRKEQTIGDAPAAADRNTAEAEPGSPPSDHRRRAWTEAGGLLYLVHLVGRLGLPERLLTNDALVGRPLVWSLHRIAMRLCGLADDDPAALAFCGLGPGARPPAYDALPATPYELAALDAIAAELAQTLAEALERRAEPPESVVSEVCRRRAEVVADLGWIDVLFSLDDVSLEIRRSGLDLDPGWVPWLGVVLRFVYG